MGAVDSSLLERYGHVLRTLDREAAQTPPDQYLELLGPGEVDDLLLIRNRLSEIDLNSKQEVELRQADDVLLRHHRLIAEWLSPGSVEEPTTRWWWHLDEGPQVRAEAEAA